MHAFVLPLSTKAGDDLHAVIRAVHEVPTCPYPSSHISKAVTLILLTSTKQSSPREKNHPLPKQVHRGSLYAHVI